MYILFALINDEEKEIGRYNSYSEAFYAGLNAHGFCEFWIEEA